MNNQQSKPTTHLGWVKLTTSMVLVALVWFALLPSVSRIPSVKQRLDWLDAQGIDPSAMFYTELDLTVPATTIAEDTPRCRPTR